MNKQRIIVACICIINACLVLAQGGTPIYNEVGVDQLTVERENGQQIKVMWTSNLNVKKHIDWRALLTDFQTDFGKVDQDIPAYDYSTVNYVQGQSLVVDEVVGQETYTVNDQGGFDYVKSNTCRLQGDNLIIKITFDDYSELLESSLFDDVGNAIDKVKHRFYISTVTAEKFVYEADTKSLTRPRNKLALYVPGGVNGGVFRNKHFVELRIGAGITINDRTYVTLGMDYMISYLTERRESQSDTYLTLRTGEIQGGLSADIGFQIEEGITLNEDILFRVGLSYMTKSGITLGSHYYIARQLGDFSHTLDFDFYVGYTF